MKLKRKISILLCIFMGLSFNTLKINAETQENVKPELTVKANNEDNSISLKWDMGNTDKKYSYMIYSKSSDETVFQSIPAKATAKVLNIYPSAGNNLKTWMETNGYGKGLITVDEVDINKFNKDADSYLKNSDGSWKYDVLYIGAWDCNNGLNLNDDAVNLVSEFIDAGRGVLAGHDTIGYAWGTNNGLGKIRDKFNIKVGHWNSSGGVDSGHNYFGGFLSDKAILKKKGLLTNYPWTLGEVGTVFNIPKSHSTSNFAYGDIWMTYPDNELYPGTTIPSSLYENANFYLTTWNNTAMIQTGHNRGQATPDEQKILANTLFYLSQVTEETNWIDHKGQDLAAPTTPNITSVNKNSDNQVNIAFDKSEDRGLTYEYYVEATEKTTGQVVKSDTKSVEIVSGLKGYSIVIDDNPNTIPDNNIETTSNNYTINQEIKDNTYVHVAAVDNAGNVSEVSTYKYSYPTLKLTPSTTDIVKDKVTIKAEASSLSKEIVKIVTPDGNEVSGSEASYDVDVNGIYTFKAVDSDGNEVTESIDIQNIIHDVILNVEPDKNTVHLQEKVVVDLTIDNIKNIGGVDVRVKYDNSKLEFIDFTEVTGVKLYNQKVENGEMRFTLFGEGHMNFVNNKKTLVKLNFKPIAEGNALIDVTKGRVSDGKTLEKDLRDAECGETTINIINRKLKEKFTLLDVTMIADHIGEDPEKLLPDMDLDLNLDGKINQEDVDIAYRLMMENPDYNF